MHDGVLPSVAPTRGYALAFRTGAVLLVVGVLVVALLERVVATPRMAGVEVDAVAAEVQAA